MNAEMGDKLISKSSVTDEASEVISVRLLELVHRTKILRVLGFAISSLTLSLALVVVAPRIGFIVPTSSVIIATGFANVICVLGFEILRKNGDALFQEISDELQWRIGRKSKLPRSKEPSISSATPQLKVDKYSKYKPDLDARIILRNFTLASDLPLIPGRFSPAIYIGLNFALVFLSGSYRI